MLCKPNVRTFCFLDEIDFFTHLNNFLQIEVIISENIIQRISSLLFDETLLQNFESEYTSNLIQNYSCNENFSNV